MVGSFFCNQGTLFDQRTLSCRAAPAALACAQSGHYYAAVDFYAQYNYFDRLRQDQHQRDVRASQQQHHHLQRLQTQLA